jgi:hypothetical protein
MYVPALMAVSLSVLAAQTDERPASASLPDEIVFAVRQPGAGSHWYENFGYYAQDENAKAYRALGQLCRLNLNTGQLTILLDDPQGSVRDPQMDYDGRKILFSYRPGGSDHFHLSRHYGVQLTKREVDMIRYWIESAAPYPGTYAALGSGMIGGYPKSQLDISDRRWPSSVDAAEAIQRRCAACHGTSRPLPKYLSDDLGLVLSNPDPDDIRIRWSRHLFFNLTHPEKSLMLLAPLGKEAGGYGLCRPDGAASGTGAVFADRSDPDYQKLLALCRTGKEHLSQIKRFDMPGFEPPAMYVREIKRFGILPQRMSAAGVIDAYATDQAYWRSLWWQPAFPPGVSN